MVDNCPHDKLQITVDDEGETKQVCPVCDDVAVETLDESDADNDTSGIGSDVE